MSSVDLHEILQGLGAKKTLDRERALAQFVMHIQSVPGNYEALPGLWQGLLGLVHDAKAWESRLGGLMGAKALLGATTPGHLTSSSSADSLAPLFEACLHLLEDEEPRVRVAVGEVLGQIARVQGPDVWLRAQPAIMASIRENYDRDGEGEKRGVPEAGLTQASQAHQTHPGGSNCTGKQDAYPSNADASSSGGSAAAQGRAEGGGKGGGFLEELLSSSYKPKIPGVGEMRHGTEGWRCLETSMRTMAAVLDGAGATLAPHIKPGLVELVAKSMHHPNRYVREAAHAGACALFRAVAGASQAAGHTPACAQTVQQGGVLVPPVPKGACRLGEQRQQDHLVQQGQVQQLDVSQQGQGQLQHKDKLQGGLQQARVCSGQQQAQVHEEGRPHCQQQQQGEQLQKGQGTGAVPGDCHYSLLDLGLLLAAYMADGLTDNWSQVRLSACVSTRTLLLLMLEVYEHFDPLLPVLLPPMCLNRYYVAEGVRSYAQETWQLVMGGEGRMFVAQHIQQITDYYAAQSKAAHHGVREAACACIAELAEKVKRTAVEPHMPRLLHCMLLCFKDMAWPVRDAACVACGRCALWYPEACKPRLQELLDLWCAHLWDNVQCVRENSARALADALQGIPHGAPLAAVHHSIRELLPKAYEQPQDGRGRQHDRSSSRSTSRTTPHTSSAPQKQVMSGQSTKPSSRPRSFGRPRTASPSAGRPLSPARMMEQALKNDPMFCPTDEDMGLFDAGAAARFSTAFYIKGDGCMDFGFSRDQEPWEASDGAVFMVRELACVHPEECTQHLPPLVDLVAAASNNNFEGAPKLRETVWRCLPAIAKAIGKVALKHHLLEGLLAPLMDDLTCSTLLTEAAAGKAVAALRDMLGPSIFLARLSPKQATVMLSSPHVPSPALHVSTNPLPHNLQQGSACIPTTLGPQLGLGRGH